MINKKNQNKNKNINNTISLRIIGKCFLTIIAFYICVGLFIVFEDWTGLISGILYYISPELKSGLAYYYHYKFVQCLAIFLILCTILIVFYYFKKAVSYLQQVVNSTKKIVNDHHAKINLPNDIQEVEIQLNDLRNDIIANENIAKESNQKKNDLIVYLAHDLKTPLTSITGYLTLLKDEKELPENIRDKYTNIVYEKSLRLENLINEFFEITRYNFAQDTLDLETINLSLLIEQLTFEYQPVFANKNITLETELIDNISIKADSNKLQRAFDNLFNNTFNYAYENSTFNIKMTLTKPQEINLTFMNEGKTIPPEKLDKMFDPFYRGDYSRSSYTGGSGLGLAVSKEIIQAHHGSISLDSFDDKIIFNISLPINS